MFKKLIDNIKNRRNKQPTKKIITKGKTWYRTQCNDCYCVFEYSRSRILHTWGGEGVYCPFCGKLLLHDPENYIDEENEDV